MSLSRHRRESPNCGRRGALWGAGLGCLACIVASGSSGPGAQERAGGGLPKELATLPADPRPGAILAESGSRTARLVLQALDVEAGFGTANDEKAGKSFSFRLLPYTTLSRFGAPGAAPDEFRPGDRVWVKLAPVRQKPPAPAGSYALEIWDEITDQIRAGHSYAVVSQDRDNYTFTLQRQDETGAPAGDAMVLDYGPRTFLVLREDPVYVFRVPVGAHLWINVTFPPGRSTPMAREVLDEVSRDRFRKQQRIRAAVRADARGAPAHLIANGPGGARLRLFPAHREWSEQFRAGDVVTVGPRNAGGIESRVADAGSGAVSLQRPVPGARVGVTLTLRPVRGGVEYARDIQPILDVNCLGCHRDGNAQSGYSISSPERMRAGGRRGAGLVPGSSGQSLLYLTMTGERNPRMPPDREPIAEELALIKAWIDAGAQTDAKPP